MTLAAVCWEEAHRWGACVNSMSWLAIISRSEGADMLRRKTGCLALGTPVLLSDTDLEAETGEQDEGYRCQRLRLGTGYWVLLASRPSRYSRSGRPWQHFYTLAVPSGCYEKNSSLSDKYYVMLLLSLRSPNQDESKAKTSSPLRKATV